MTIAAANPSYIQIPGNGIAATFAFPFKIFAATDLVVGFITSGVYALQLSGFTVQNIDIDGGGQVTFFSPPPTGTTVDIRSLTPETQSTEFANLGAFLPEAHTEAFDRATRIMQDQSRLTYTFGIHGPDHESVPWPALPLPAARAGLALMFDSVSGLPTVGVPITQTLTPGLLGLVLYPQTAAEISAGVTAVQPQYSPGNVWRYFPGVPVFGSDWTTAIQTAINQHCYGGASVFFPMVAAVPSTRPFTSNYNISGPLVVPNAAAFTSLQFRGESSRLSFAGPAIAQGGNFPIFSFSSNQSCAFDFDGIGFVNAGTALPTGQYGMIDIQPTGSNPNSFYFRRCWFQGPLLYAIYIGRGDDIQITNCTFDTSPGRWLGFGSTANPCTNVEVSGNTFFSANMATMVDLVNVQSFNFSNNRIYSSSVITRGINCQITTPMGDPVSIQDAIVANNVWEGVQTIVQVDYRSSNFSLVGNTARACGGSGIPAVGIGGMTLIYGLKIVDNTLSGFCGTGVGMIDATGTGLADCVIKGNILQCAIGGSSQYGINIYNSANSGVDVDNVVVGATTAIISAGQNVRVRITGDQPMIAGTGPVAPQAISANGSTISTAGLENVPVISSTSYTGLILQAGTVPWQRVCLISQAGTGDSLTFAASGSNVATGSACVLSNGIALDFVWNPLTNAWHVAS